MPLMRSRRVLALVAVVYSALSLATPDNSLPPREARFPVTHDAAVLSAAFEAPGESDGSGVAIEGTVVSVVTLRNGLPGIVLEVSEQPRVQILAIHSTKIEESGILHAGARLRVMGFLRHTQDMVKLLGIEAKNDRSLTLMSLCIVQPETLSGTFDKTYINICADWQHGRELGQLRE
jgi:hypothetical protein